MSVQNDTPAGSKSGTAGQFDILKYLGEGEQHWATLLAAGDFANASKTAESCVRTLEGLPEDFWTGIDPQTATFLRREISFFQILRDHAIGIFKNKSRDFRGSAEIFENIVVTARAVAPGLIGENDPRPNQFRYFGHFAESRISLMSASEALLRGDWSSAFKYLSKAERVVEDIVPEILRPDVAADIPLQSAEPDALSLLQKIDIYAAFVIDTAMLYTAAAAVGANLHAAAEFFARHEAKVARLQDNLKDSALAEPLAVIWQPLVGFFGASRHQVDGRIALEEKDFAKALSSYETARRNFGDLSRNIPRKLPNAELLREVSHSMSFSSLPQMIERVEREKALSERIAFLEAQNETRASELREAMVEREEIIRDFLRSFRNLNIRIENESDIRQTLNLGAALPDKGLDAVLRVLDDIRDQIPKEQAGEIEAAANDAKNEENFAKKIQKVANIIDTFGKLAASITAPEPYGRTAYKILRGVFS